MWARNVLQWSQVSAMLLIFFVEHLLTDSAKVLTQTGSSNRGRWRWNAAKRLSSLRVFVNYLLTCEVDTCRNVV